MSGKKGKNKYIKKGAIDGQPTIPHPVINKIVPKESILRTGMLYDGNVRTFYSPVFFFIWGSRKALSFIIKNTKEFHTEEVLSDVRYLLHSIEMKSHHLYILVVLKMFVKI